MGSRYHWCPVCWTMLSGDPGERCECDKALPKTWTHGITTDEDGNLVYGDEPIPTPTARPEPKGDSGE